MSTASAKIQLIADWLEKQAADNSITDGMIWQELAMSQRNYYRFKPQAIEELNRRAALKQKAIDEAIVHEGAEGARKGLKSKLERALILQEQVDEILLDLQDDSNTIMDKAYLRKTLKDVQAEISKIEGDYAPEKMEHSGSIQPFNDKQVDRIIETLRNEGT